MCVSTKVQVLGLYFNLHLPSSKAFFFPLLSVCMFNILIRSSYFQIIFLYLRLTVNFKYPSDFLVSMFSMSPYSFI